MSDTDSNSTSFKNPVSDYFQRSMSFDTRVYSNGERLFYSGNRPLVNLHIAPVPNAKGTIVSVQGHMESPLLTSGFLIKEANEQQLNFVSIESYQHSVTAKHDLSENAEFNPNRNINELQLALCIGLRQFKRLHEISRLDTMFLGHSMATRACSNLILSDANCAKLFKEYTFTEAYALNAPIISHSRDNSPKSFESFKGRKSVKNMNIMGRAYNIVIYTDNLVMQPVIPGYEKPRTSSIRNYTPDYLQAICSYHDFSKTLGAKKVNFVFAKESEAVNIDLSEKFYELFNIENKAKFVIEHADHNFDTVQPKKGTAIPDTAPAEYRAVMSLIFQNFAARCA